MTGSPDPRTPATPAAPATTASTISTARLDIDVVRPGALLRLNGRLDARSAPTTRTTLHDAVDTGDGELVIEMNRAEIWDGTGLGVIVGTGRRARQAGRQLVLTGVQARELRLLRVARVTWTSSVRPAAMVC
ncbi:STAS domain-containing protein [Kineosporia succinea]|uniref:Anti-anti-sigma factor n=1 Tax=Kineosporia succinea TaxID=84632 RepID=A0ABT9P4C4_9ACTN|nr:STAS domain-containing protein [Kineosporia succinea]MDP9827532.1 anti-anti-sigma factor [Kineosporia succinea]